MIYTHVLNKGGYGVCSPVSDTRREIVHVKKIVGLNIKYPKAFF